VLLSTYREGSVVRISKQKNINAPSNVLTITMDNILLLTVDSLRADHVGYHGYDRDTTPNLDLQATSSHTMFNAFSNGCGTSRSFPSIMSSAYPRMYGGFEPISEDRLLLAEITRDAGYQTAGFHSNPYLNEQFGYDRGFETFFTSESDSSRLGDLRQWVKDTFDESSPIFKLLKAGFDLSERTIGFNPGTPFVRADKLTDYAVQWARDAESGPRFLWVHYMDVHHPYAPPEQYQLEFRDEPVSDRRAIQLRRKMLEEPGEITDEELQTLIDLYDGEIKYFDHHANRLIETISELWGDDTIVGFTSDHGDELLDHGGFSHYDRFYDELVNVPLLIDVGDDGDDHDELVELLDLAPTLLDYAGVSSPEDFLGSSLRSVFEADEWEKDGVCIEAESGRAYRTKEWKFIDTDSETQLFDLVEDPEERTDIHRERPELVDQFRARLERYEQYELETDTAVQAVDIDGETQSRLEDLGYLR
jgi:arylsulfatase A-like enzyme